MSISYMQFTKLKTEEDFKKAHTPKDLYAQCNEQIGKLPYYSTHKFRKNGVMCLDFLFVGEISAEQEAKWRMTNQTWLTEYFTESTTLMEIHREKDGRYEQHVYIIPLSPRGAVSCDWYCGGKEKLRYMHASYAATLQRDMQMATAPLMTFTRNQNRVPGYNPFSKIQIPELSKFSTPEAYEQAVGQYIEKLNTQYETKIQDLQSQVSDKLVVENKLLRKENHRLDKYVGPFVQFISTYGGLDKTKKMLATAQMFQYAIRLYQEDADQESIGVAQHVLDDGMRYMERHNIKQN